ncbi:MAG TPA: hypothetical protein VKR32_15420 [Puia sp.]|nr:hypothetical protein [Puia sp.]
MVTAILAGFYWIALLIFPVKSVASYGITLDACTTVVVRLFDPAIGGYASFFG